MTEPVAEIRKVLQEHEARIAKLESILTGGISAPASRVRRKSLAIREFLREKKPRTSVERTLTVAYYLEQHQQVDGFTVDEVEGGFRSAKEPAPSNTHAFINQNIKNGHIMECKQKKNGRKTFVLTSSGEELVENGFDKQKT